MGVTKHAIYRRLKKFDEYHELREDENKQRDETTEEIVGLLEEGVSTNDIIDILGWNRSKFHSWLHRKAISVSRPPPKFDVEEAWKLFKSGESTGKLAIRYKVDRIAITRAFRRGHAQEYVDIVSRSRKGGRKHGTKVGNSWNVVDGWASYLTGDTPTAIGKRYGMNRGTIMAAFKVHYGDEYRKIAAERLTTHRANASRWCSRSRSRTA